MSLKTEREDWDFSISDYRSAGRAKTSADVDFGCVGGLGFSSWETNNKDAFERCSLTKLILGLKGFFFPF